MLILENKEILVLTAKSGYELNYCVKVNYVKVNYVNYVCKGKLCKGKTPGRI